MSTHLTTAFGFQRTVINGRYNLWSGKLSLENGVLPLPIIGGVDISFSRTVSKKGKMTEKIILKYATMDYSEHERMQRAISLFKEEHAIAKIKRKHAWLHESKPSSKIDEISLEDVKKDLPW